MESSVLLLTQPHPWRPKYSFHSLFQNPLPSSQPSRSYTPKYRRWDSNAETIRSQRFGFNLRDKGNKEEEDDADGDEEEEEDYNYNGSKEKKKRRWWSDDYSESEMEEGSGGILDEAIDSVWILKVLTFTSFLVICINCDLGCCNFWFDLSKNKNKRKKKKPRCFKY